MAQFSADLGRKFRRVVQMADQRVGRAERSEVLTDEVHSMERQMDLIGKAYQSTVKRLQACLPSVADPEKRLKSLPESMFAASLNESALALSQSTVFSKSFGICGEAEQKMAEAFNLYTLEVEKTILQPLLNVVDRDMKGILKLRKQLTKMTLDMDSAKKAYIALQKQAQVPPGKIDAAREELEAEEVKVERCKDQLVTEMYQFFSSEEKLCSLLLSILQVQADYHQQSVELLNDHISRMSEEIERCAVRAVYGCDLKEHLAHTKQEIATVIEVCVQSIQRHGLSAEGIFRVAPSASKLRKLTAAFDANVTDIAELETDVHSLAGALKLYLRELPEPLMTYELYDDWSDAMQRPAHERLQAVLDVVNRLPKQNHDNLRYLVKFMAKITENSSVNKMSASNLTIVMAPNLLWPSRQDKGFVQVTGVAMTSVEMLISNCDWFFPDAGSGGNGDNNNIVHSKGEGTDTERGLKQLARCPHGEGTDAERGLKQLARWPAQKQKKVMAPAPPDRGRSVSNSSEFEQQDNSVLAKHQEVSELLQDVPNPPTASPTQNVRRSLEKPTAPPPPPPAKPRVGEAAKEMATDSRGDESSLVSAGSSSSLPEAGSKVVEDDCEVFHSSENLQDRNHGESWAGDSAERTMGATPVLAVGSGDGGTQLSDGDLQVVPKKDTRDDDHLDSKTKEPCTVFDSKSKEPGGFSSPDERQSFRRRAEHAFRIRTSSLSSSPPSPVFSPIKEPAADLLGKSSTLPAVGTGPVEAVRIKFLSDSTSENFGQEKPEVTIETKRPRPQVPPRLPAKEDRCRLSDEARKIPKGEDTHL